MTTELTTTEQRNLADLEGVIARGVTSFVEVGAALLKIRDEALFRQTHDTFEAYCRERWNMIPSRVSQVISAARVAGELKNFNLNEEQARALKDVEPEMRADVVEEAVRTAPARRDDARPKLTARHIRETARRVAAKPEPVVEVVVVDDNGEPIPDAIQGEYAEAQRELASLATVIGNLRREVNGLAEKPAGAFVDLRRVMIDLQNAANGLLQAAPAVLCAKCSGDRCRDCNRRGWTPRQQQEAAA
jgi:hypothetical protein